MFSAKERSPKAASSKGEKPGDDAPENAATPSFLKLFSLAVPEWKALLISVIFMVAAEGTGLYNPILVADAYDALIDISISSSERMDAINWTMIAVLIIHAAGLLAGFLRGAIMAAVGERVVARLRNNLYSRILSQEIAFFDEHKSGELVSRLGSDTTLIQVACSTAVPEVVVGFCKVVVCIALMFWLSPPLAGVSIGFTVVIFMVCGPVGKKLAALSKAYQDVLGEAQNRSTEALGSARTVQAFAAEEREKDRYREKIGDPDSRTLFIPLKKEERKSTTYGIGLSKAWWTSGFYTWIFGVGFGSLYVSLWYGFKLVNSGQMTLGQLTAFNSYIFQIASGLGMTARFLTQVMEARGASGRVFQLLERIPTIPTPAPPPDQNCKTGDSDEESPSKPAPSPMKPKSMGGHIELRNVSFSYASRPDVPVLKGFNLTIPKNTTAALVGSSGAGKSTVVSLLQRFYDVTEGSITIDGLDLRDLDLQWLRANIGYVQQEPSLFGLTVKENVCYGVSKSVSQEEVERVCKQANAHDFIMQWPDGYDTMVGERGVKLSGGQKQRIAIARALLVDPKVLLLDEATSALDAESEHLVQEAIENAVVGRTVLIIAHRLSTVKEANQIIVLDEQQIVDAGSHDVLMRRCSKYQDLIKRQSSVFVGKES